MSIIIKGMDMPKYGDTFKVYLDAADNVLLVDTSDSSRFYTLVEVKEPHGRLIDADYVSNSFCAKITPVVRRVAEEAPTIIEAEGKDDG